MALLAYLPGGLAETDVRSLIGERAAVSKTKANEAVVCLNQLRLVERRPDLRLRMLTPLRECAKIDLPLLKDDRERIVDGRAGQGAVRVRRRWERARGDHPRPRAGRGGAAAATGTLSW